MADNTTFPPTVWNVDTVVSVTDGDTVRLVRSRALELDGRRYRLTDLEPKGISHRLAWVDIPERGTKEWAQAKLDLRHWIDLHGPLRAIVYGSAGWDRLLVDLVDADGNSASQWLMKPIAEGGAGWPHYEA